MGAPIAGSLDIQARIPLDGKYWIDNSQLTSLNAGLISLGLLRFSKSDDTLWINLSTGWKKIPLTGTGSSIAFPYYTNALSRKSTGQTRDPHAVYNQEDDGSFWVLKPLNQCFLADGSPATQGTTWGTLSSHWQRVVTREETSLPSVVTPKTCFHGTISTLSPTGNDIVVLGQESWAIDARRIDYLSNGMYPCFAEPSSFGIRTHIVDSNYNNITTTFVVTQVLIDTVYYRVYILPNKIYSKVTLIYGLPNDSSTSGLVSGIVTPSV